MMFTASGLLNVFKISTVSADTDNPETSDNKKSGRKICKEKIKKEALRESNYTSGDCQKPRKPRVSRGSPQGCGNRLDGYSTRDRGGTKEAGDCAIPTRSAGDQETSGSLSGGRVNKVKGRGGKRVGDLGATGAAVTGSRADGDCDADTSLPLGAVYPGLLRHIHNAARYTLPQCFEGASISAKQSTNNNWVLGHSMAFSSVTPGGYKLLLSYIDKNRPSALPYFVMEAAPGGQVSCEFRVGPTQNSRAALVSQIADAELKSFESIIDLYFNKATASMIAVNREFIAFHYLQGVTRRLSLGAELVARGQFSEFSAGSGAVRWATEHIAISGTIGNRGIDLCYARAVRPHLTVAAMVEVGFAVRRAVATLAYEWRADDWVFRGSVDSDGLVGGTLHHKLGGKKSQLACAISALLNHPNNKFKLGFGITAAII